MSCRLVAKIVGTPCEASDRVCEYIGLWVLCWGGGSIGDSSMYFKM